MEIIVKKRTKLGTERQKLSVSERSSLTEKKQELETQLNDESTKHLLQDKGRIEQQLQSINQKLGSDESLIVKGKEKDSLVKQKKELEAKLRNTIDPLTRRWVKPGDPDWERAIQAGTNATEPQVTQLVEHYRDISTRLEPDDPLAGSIETIVTSA